MSGNPHSNLVHQTIQRIQRNWDDMKAGIEEIPSEKTQYEKWQQQVPYLKQLSFHHSVCILLWDIRSSHFVFAIDERKISQYDMSVYTRENGVEFSLSNFHPDHIHAVQLMNQSAAVSMGQYPQLPSDRMVVNIDALYRVGNGNYIHILQQIVPVETDDHGRPYLFLSYIRDITHLKKQPSSACIFTTPDDAHFWRYSMPDKQLEAITPFTLQEKKILTLLSEGKTTKQIADGLSLSPHTVDTHRRNMLAKTNCIDSTALVAYCQLIGLL